MRCNRSGSRAHSHIRPGLSSLPPWPRSRRPSRAIARTFPKVWSNTDDRYDAREILNEQFELLEYAKRKRLEVLKNGFVLSDVIIDRADDRGLAARQRCQGNDVLSQFCVVHWLLGLGFTS